MTWRVRDTRGLEMCHRNRGKGVYRLLEDILICLKELVDSGRHCVF